MRVGEVAEQIRGVTYKKSDARTAPAPGFVPLLGASNIVNGELVFGAPTYVRADTVAPRQMLRPGDVLIATSSGSKSVVGKAATVVDPMGATFGAFCKVLRPADAIDHRYFAHFFQTLDYRRIVSEVSAGANINNLRSADLDDLTLRVPPIGDQRRIAAILDHANSLARCARRAHESAKGLAAAVFRQMFSGDLSSEAVPLGELADVGSGITKGRRLGGQATISAPYLAVSNVQDGSLKLDVVKTIEVTASERRRFVLEPGDLVMTEGGDPDKLGRGTVWRGEIDSCLHQNHIFRVRILDDRLVRPTYLASYVASRPSRDYFLRSAKQTTGIATINKSQLRALPVVVPSLARQRELEDRLDGVSARVAQLVQSSEYLDGLFASLQARAFSGQL